MNAAEVTEAYRELQAAITKYVSLDGDYPVGWVLVTELVSTESEAEGSTVVGTTYAKDQSRVTTLGLLHMGVNAISAGTRPV